MFMKLSRSIPLIFACAVLEFYGTKMSRCARDCVLFISFGMKLHCFTYGICLVIQGVSKVTIYSEK